MRVHLLSLAFDSARGGFDPAPLEQLQASQRIRTVEHHLFEADARLWLALLVCCDEPTSAPASTPHAVAAPARAHDAPAARPCEPPGTDAEHDRRAEHDRSLAGLSEEQRALYDRLRAWRSQHAHDEGIPPFLVFKNSQLLDIVRQGPRTRAALGRIAGVGNGKLQRFGDAVLGLVRGDDAAPVPTPAPPQPTGPVAVAEGAP
ncbi:MAG: HRDC domain-containing protein [Planctomycetes bacterium]|nr:HRDC domain-containing protein [Planctomycetota bacterium]